MMISEQIPYKLIQNVLELYLCSDDPRIKHISIVLNIDEVYVLQIVEGYLNKQISFEKGRFMIINSEINY